VNKNGEPSIKSENTWGWAERRAEVVYAALEAIRDNMAMERTQESMRDPSTESILAPALAEEKIC